MKIEKQNPGFAKRVKSWLTGKYVENGNTASQNIPAGKWVTWKGQVCRAKTAITTGDTLSSANLDITGDEGAVNALSSKIMPKIAYSTPTNLSGTWLNTIDGNVAEITVPESGLYFCIARLITDMNATDDGQYSVNYMRLNGSNGYFVNAMPVINNYRPSSLNLQAGGLGRINHIIFASYLNLSAGDIVSIYTEYNSQTVQVRILTPEISLIKLPS